MAALAIISGWPYWRAAGPPGRPRPLVVCRNGVIRTANDSTYQAIALAGIFRSRLEIWPDFRATDTTRPASISSDYVRAKIALAPPALGPAPAIGCVVGTMSWPVWPTVTRARFWPAHTTRSSKGNPVPSDDRVSGHLMPPTRRNESLTSSLHAPTKMRPARRPTCSTTGRPQGDQP